MENGLKSLKKLKAENLLQLEKTIAEFAICLSNFQLYQMVEMMFGLEEI